MNIKDIILKNIIIPKGFGEWGIYDYYKYKKGAVVGIVLCSTYRVSICKKERDVFFKITFNVNYNGNIVFDVVTIPHDALGNHPSRVRVVKEITEKLGLNHENKRENTAVV